MKLQDEINQRLKSKKSKELVTIKFESENLNIPYRILFEPNSEINLYDHCLLTRSFDGYVRQNAIKVLLSNFQSKSEIIPFIAILIGEYIVEILEIIYRELSLSNWKELNKFFKNNPIYYQSIKSKVRSYWNCYYQNSNPNYNEYVGNKILEKLITTCP